MPGTARLTGLHAPVYLPDEWIERCRAEVQRLYVRMHMGDELTALERVALEVLKTNGLL